MFFILWTALALEILRISRVGCSLDDNTSAVNRFEEDKGEDLERHNFQGDVLKIAYFQEGNLVKFLDNGAKISGVCGEIWNILADYLNFTLVPIFMRDRNFGGKLDNGSYDGILRLIQINESQIIPRCGVFTGRLPLLEYTVPLWTIRYHLYVKPEWIHDEAWMFHLFTRRVWYSFLTLLAVLGLVGYFFEKIPIWSTKDTYTLPDHTFYTIAIASGQGSVPSELHNRSRIIYICISMFSWVICNSLSSTAIIFMTSKTFVLPFTDLRTLIQQSNYDIVAFSGSMVHERFKTILEQYCRRDKDLDRVLYVPSALDLFEKVCTAEKRKFAAFEAEDRRDALGKDVCRLVPAETSYFETWIASGVKRGFRYKRSFDVGIIRLLETGLVSGLKRRWFDCRRNEKDDLPFQSIGMGQVHLIFGILASGFFASVVILSIENFIFVRNKVVAKARTGMSNRSIGKMMFQLSK